MRRDQEIRQAEGILGEVFDGELRGLVRVEAALVV
jgi:hypothetical protein